MKQNRDRGDAPGRRGRHGRATRVPRRASIRRPRRAPALVVREGLFRALVEEASDAIVLLDRDATVRWASQSTARVLGYAVEDLTGASALSFVHRDDRARVAGALRDCAEQPGRPINAELRLRLRGGGWRVVEGTAIGRLDDPEVGAIVVTLRDITERKRGEERLVHQAAHDALTGLPNRSSLSGLLAGAVERAASRRGYRYAVVFVDLDGFKQVNDRYGHLTGDRLLVAVARRIERALRPGDTVARLAGDEFIVLLDGLRRAGDALRVSRRVRRALLRPFEIGGAEVRITASIGVAIGPARYRCGEDVLQDADLAMYRGKAAGGDRLVLLAPAAEPAACRTRSAS